jgi:sulfate transport system permease protein
VSTFLLRRHTVLPGFNIALGFTLLYLCLLVLIPLSAAFLKTATLTWEQFWAVVTTDRVVASYKLSFGAALIGATINAVFGLLVAWVLVRYTFPGKRFIDALVDLPFALPTAVAGIALTGIYAPNGWIGEWLASLGATRLQTFVRIIFPAIMPALLTGFALAFARAVGEYGSVIFIAGNIPLKTEITPLLIITKLEQYDYTGATALAVVMLVASFILLLAINVLQWWTSRRGTKAR